VKDEIIAWFKAHPDVKPIQNATCPNESCCCGLAALMFSRTGETMANLAQRTHQIDYVFGKLSSEPYDRLCQFLRGWMHGKGGNDTECEGRDAWIACNKQWEERQK